MQFGSATSGPDAPKPPWSSGASRGKGVGKLAERLIVEHPDWMRMRGKDVPLRRQAGGRPREAAS